MTVKELIEELQKFDPTLHVLIKQIPSYLPPMSLSEVRLQEAGYIAVPWGHLRAHG